MHKGGGERVYSNSKANAHQREVWLAEEHSTQATRRSSHQPDTPCSVCRSIFWKTQVVETGDIVISGVHMPLRARPAPPSGEGTSHNIHQCPRPVTDSTLLNRPVSPFPLRVKSPRLRAPEVSSSFLWHLHPKRPHVFGLVSPFTGLAEPPAPRI